MEVLKWEIELPSAVGSHLIFPAIGKIGDGDALDGMWQINSIAVQGV
jgi:hypothetical protein